MKLWSILSSLDVFYQGSRVFSHGALRDMIVGVSMVPVSLSNYGSFLDTAPFGGIVPRRTGRGAGGGIGVVGYILETSSQAFIVIIIIHPLPPCFRCASPSPPPPVTQYSSRILICLYAFPPAFFFFLSVKSYQILRLKYPSRVGLGPRTLM